MRAEFLRALLVDGAAAEGAVAMLRLRGAWITGELDLEHATVEAPIRLRECEFDARPSLYGARLRQVDLGGSRLPGLLADRSQIDGELRMTGCRLTSSVTLNGAQISGSLLLDGIRTSGLIRLDGADIADALVLNGAAPHGDDPNGAAPHGDDPNGAAPHGDHPNGAAPHGAEPHPHAAAVPDEDREGAAALQAVNTRTGGGVAAVGLSAHGTVLLTGARVEGSLNLEHSDLTAPGGKALVATVVTVGLDLLCNEVRAEGEVRFTRSRIGGRVHLEGARFSNPGGTALRLSGTAVGAEVSAAGLGARGQVKLRGARLSGALVLTGARLSHPGGAALLASRAAGAELWLDGLTYQALAPHLPPTRRLALPTRDGDGYVPYSYEQLAAVYRRSGDESAARTVPSSAGSSRRRSSRASRASSAASDRRSRGVQRPRQPRQHRRPRQAPSSSSASVLVSAKWTSLSSGRGRKFSASMRSICRRSPS